MKDHLNILVTGASRGIGNAIAKSISHRAQKLLVVSHYPDSLNEGVKKIEEIYSGTILKYTVDQAEGLQSADQLSKWVHSQVDHLDAIILCAGNFFEGELALLPSDQFQNTMNTNFTFNYHIVRELLPLLKRGTHSKIIMIGSTAAYSPYSVPSYSITKFALCGFALNLRSELMKDNIGVTFVSPGGTLTDMWSDVEVPPNRLLEPNDIAKVVDSLFELSPQAVVEEIIIRPMLGEYDG